MKEDYTQCLMNELLHTNCLVKACTEEIISVTTS